MSQLDIQIVMNTISRGEKIKMYLQEYYLGHEATMNFLRITGGPSLVVFGALMISSTYNKIEIMLGILSVLWGAFLVLKPYMVIMILMNNYKSNTFSVEINDGKIRFRTKVTTTEYSFASFRSVKKRRDYFAMTIKGSKKIYVPCKVLTADQIAVLDNQVK